MPGISISGQGGGGGGVGGDGGGSSVSGRAEEEEVILFREIRRVFARIFSNLRRDIIYIILD